MSGQLHVLAALWPWGKSPQFLLDSRPDGPQSRSSSLEKRLLAFFEKQTTISESSSL